MNLEVIHSGTVGCVDDECTRHPRTLVGMNVLKTTLENALCEFPISRSLRLNHHSHYKKRGGGGGGRGVVSSYFDVVVGE